MVLAPFSGWRAAIGTTFIIDLWFSGIIVAELAASALRRGSRVPAVAAGVLLAGYVGFRYLQKHRALEIGAQYARSQGLAGARIEAQTRPVSPFNWTVFVSDDEAHRFAHINLVRRQQRVPRPGEGFIAMLDAAYLPVAQARWERRTRYGEGPSKPLVQEAWQSPPSGSFAGLPICRPSTA